MTLFSAVMVNEDVEVVSDFPDPDGEIKVILSCWNISLVRGDTRLKGWLDAP